MNAAFLGSFMTFSHLILGGTKSTKSSKRRPFSVHKKLLDVRAPFDKWSLGSDRERNQATFALKPFERNYEIN